MAERKYPQATSPCEEIKGSVCIHTDKVYDSCKDKDCIEDARVFLTASGQEIVDGALSVKAKRAEIIWAFPDVEPVPFNKGYFTVDIKFYIKVILEVYTGSGRPCTVEGLVVFDKKAILFGSEGAAKVFASGYRHDSFDEQLWKKTNMPKAVVEVVDPLCLGTKLLDLSDPLCSGCDDLDFTSVPECVCNVFEDRLMLSGDKKRVFVSIGLFSIVKIERSVQLLIPAYDFCVPQKECSASSDDSPCDLFERVNFPFEEFFPPEREICAEPTDTTGCGCTPHSR